MKILLLLATLFICCFKIGFTQPGAPDFSFGKKGIVRTNIGANISYSSTGKQVLSLPDGSMYVVFETPNESDWLFPTRILIAKVRPDGSPDSTYGNAGYSAPVIMENTHAALQKDGKIVVAGTIIIGDYSYDNRDYDDYRGQNYNFVLMRFNTDGSLDNTFNGNGKVTTDFAGFYDAVNSIAIQSDGKIVVAGFASLFGDEFSYDSTSDSYVYPHLSDNIAIARYNVNGSPDNSFNATGHLLTQLQINSNNATSVAVQIDGKIAVAGLGNKGFTLARFDPDGSADNTFKVTDNLTKPDSSYFAPRALAIQGDGKIVLGGIWQNTTGYNDFVLARFTAGGSLDKTFDTDGIQTTDFRTYNDVINSVVIQNDGKIVAAGSASNGKNNAFAIARYNTNGSPDNTFDTDGKKMNFITSNNVYAVSLAIGNNGKLVAAGSEQTGTKTNIAITKYNTDGSFDNTFNRSGTAIVYFKQKNTVFSSSAVQKDGKIVAAGHAWNGTNYDNIVVRYNTNGSADTSFSSDGILIIDTSSNIYTPSIAFQADGKIVVATGSLIARYNTNGTLDNTFGTNGKHTASFAVSVLKVQQDGKIAAAGDTTLARYSTNGSLDNSFNEKGKIITTFVIKDFELQSDGKLVIGGGGEYSEQIAIVRYNTNGSQDLTFNMQYTPWSEDDNYPPSTYLSDIIIQKDGKIVIGGTLVGGYTFSWYANNIIARYNNDGSLDKTFSEDGMFSNFSSGYSCSIALQDDGKILIRDNIEENIVLDPKDNISEYVGFAIQRLNTDGSFDNTFSVINNYEINRISSINIVNDKLYAVGYNESFSRFGFLARYNLTENKAPVVKIVTPANNAIYKAPATITINATANDSDGVITSVKLYSGGTLLKTDSTSPYTFTLSNLTAGNYSFVAKAADNYGLTSSSSSVAVAVSVTANKAPTVSLTSPANNAVYIAPAAITIGANATDPDGTISKVQFYNGGILLKTDSTSPYTYTWSNAAAGSYSIIAKAVDNKGLSSSSASVSVLVKANKVPVVSITDPYLDESFYAPATITISAAASDSDGTISSVKFYNGTTYLKTVFASPYTYTITNVAAGTYSFSAKATDNNGGQTTSALVKVIVTSTNTTIVSNKPVTNKTGITEEISVKLYPNPATNAINLYTSGLKQNKPADISIISVSGIVLKKVQSSSAAQMHVDVSSLAKGVYTIKIVSGDKVMFKQFLKL